MILQINLLVQVYNRQFDSLYISISVLNVEGPDDSDPQRYCQAGGLGQHGRRPAVRGRKALPKAASKAKRVSFSFLI